MKDVYLSPWLHSVKKSRATKFACALLFLSVNAFSTSSIQSPQVSIQANQISIKRALSEIEKQTDYLFVYNKEEVDLEQIINVHVMNAPISEVLALIFNGTDVVCTVEGENIMLKSHGESFNISPEKNQQKHILKGKVVDEKGEVVVGANVLLKGTTEGTITDIDGNFSIEVPNGSTLLVSYIGFTDYEIRIEGQDDISITLLEDSHALDELVVVGYGTQRKKDLTSSISSVKSENFNKGAIINNPLQMVEGKVAGLTVTRASGNDPNAGTSIQLRGVSSVKGSASPLVVIDGVPGGDLSTVLPQDIESIDVLKDGSAAAIYGTRGTNGVILVTTKKGASGKVRINYEAQLYTETIAKKLDVLSTEQYKQYGIDHDKSFIDYGADTDWFDELTKVPFSHIHNLSMSGGSENTSYRASLSYKNQEGIVSTNTTRETLNGRVSLTQKTWDDKLQVDMNLAYSMIDATFTDYTVFEQAIRRNPTEPVYNEDGSFFYPVGSEEFEFNPVARLNNKNNGAEYNRFLGDMRITLNPLPGLKGSLMMALQKNNDLTHYYESRLSEGSEERGDSGTAKRQANNGTNKTLEGTIEYNGQIGKHGFNTLVGYSYQDFMSEYFNAENYGFLSDAYQYNNLGAGSFLKEGLANMGSGKSTNKLIAFLARVNYNYDNKYLLSASVRREGSSRFGANHKWGTFPAVSAGWRINNEDFLKDIDWLSDLKVRLGYGLTGNQMSENYISIARIGTQQYIWHDDTYIRSMGMSSNPNPDLKWEVKKELNIGLDASVFDSRLGMTFDMYQRKNTDLLYQVQASVPSLIHSTIWANVGEMESKGVEVVLYGNPIRTDDMNLDLSLNLSYNKSQLLSLSNDQYLSSATYLEFGTLPAPGNLGQSIRLEENGEVGNFWGYQYLGLTKEGEWIFKDNDGNGVIDNDDKTVIGNGVPKVFAGFNGSFSYKNFDMSLQFKGAFGFDILNTKEMYYGNPNFYPSNLLISVLDKHKGINDSPQFSDYYLEKGNYLKLSNLTVGYTFTPENIKYLRNIRVYLSGDNLLTFTKYTGIDPELTSNGFETGIDARDFYPRTRTFSFGVNVGF